MFNVLALLIGFLILLSYTVVYDFSFYFAIPMTFFWGIQDGGLNTLITSLLGF